MSAKGFFDCSDQCFNSLIILKAYRLGSAESLRKIKTHFVAVHRRYVFNAKRAEHRDTNQTNRSAALYDNTAVESQDSRCFRSFHRMYEHRAGLNQDSGIQVQVAYIEYG